MTGKSTIPAHSLETVCLKNLDGWLNDLINSVKTLTARVSDLEKENENKDRNKASLNLELQILKNNQQPAALTSASYPAQAATFWSAKKATITKQLCNQIEKENKETTSKKNNVIIFGLPAQATTEEDSAETKKLIREVELSVDL